MNTTQYFPIISVKNINGRFHATCAVKLHSLLHGNLFSGQLYDRGPKGQSFNPLDPDVQQRRRESLLSPLASWPPDVCLELTLSALPNLMYRMQGNLLVTLFIHVIAATEEKAKEEAISKYLTLMPLLTATHPEAEFIPIIDKCELEYRRAPFQPTHALFVHRRQEELSLTTPYQRSSMGFTPQNDVTKGDTQYKITHCFPWVPCAEDWTKFMGTIMAQLDPIQVVVSIRPRTMDVAERERLMTVVSTCESFVTGGREYHVTLNRQVNLLRDINLKRLNELSHSCFNVGVYMLAAHPIDIALGSMLGQSITTCKSTEGDTMTFRGGFSCSEVSVASIEEAYCFSETEPFCLTETASAFRIPSPPLQECPYLPLKRSKTSFAVLPINANQHEGSLRLCVNEHSGMVQPVPIDVEDRLRHTVILGQTGTGKSTMMESMILQDIRAGRGLALIDPHGDLVDTVLGKIPRARQEDVILFDVLDRTRPVGFNLLQFRTKEERDLIIDELYITLDRVYDMKQTGGPIFESNFRGMMKLLLSDKPRDGFTPTLLEFSLCYLNEEFRNWLRKTTADPQVIDFIDELERTSGDAKISALSPYITSKLSRFIQDSTLRNIIGQEKTSFDFEDIMNAGKILLVKLGKGQFGAAVSALLSNQIVSRFKIAAMKRGERKLKDRREFFFYIDEAHNLPSEDLMQLLSEARKYRLGLILATQYAAQFTQQTFDKNNLLSAIIGNVGTFIMFRLGKEDADLLSPMLYPHFSALDIIGLPNFAGYARLQLQDASPPFSFRSEIDTTAYLAERAELIRNLSRQIYGTDIRIIEEQIAHRRAVWRKEWRENNEK